MAQKEVDMYRKLIVYGVFYQVGSTVNVMGNPYIVSRIEKKNDVFLVIITNKHESLIWKECPVSVTVAERNLEFE